MKWYVSFLMMLFLLSCLADAKLAVVDSLTTPPATDVALDGGFAYVATTVGLFKIDLSTFNIVSICLTSPANDVVLDGGFAYVATAINTGLFKIDITPPRAHHS